MHCFQQSMRECIKYIMIRAVGINTKQNNQENNNIFHVRLEGSEEYQKGVLGVFKQEKQKNRSLHSVSEWPKILEGLWFCPAVCDAGKD